MARSLEEIFKRSDEYLMNRLKESTSNLKKMYEECFQNFILYEKTGDKMYLDKELNEAQMKNLSLTENQETTIAPVAAKKGRAKKGVLTDITENTFVLQNVKVKQEKLSIISTKSKSTEEAIVSSINSNENIVLKQEMPAPRKLPPRKKRIKTEVTEVLERSTRSRKKTQKMEDYSKIFRETTSDVVIQNTTFPTVDITDDSEKGAAETSTEKNEPQSNSTRSTRSKMRLKNKEQVNVEVEKEVQSTPPIRSIRTKTIKKNKKRERSEDSETSNNKAEKKSKSVSPEASNKSEEIDANKTGQTEYEDAVSSLDNVNPADTTRVIHKNEAIESQNVNKDATFITAGTLNSTFVSEKNQLNTGDIVKDKNEEVKTNIPVLEKKKQKEIFSPYEKTSTKKKVEAFEKLGTNVVTPVSKIKGYGKEKQNSISKTLGYTPVAPKFYSTVKSNKFRKCETPSNNESLLTSKSQSALKASQAEFRERELKRQEKEREALKKRDALYLALSEAKRKKREEKMLKAQQQREELKEKENQKKIEAQKMRLEKYQQIMAEKEERTKQQREESERKRLLVKKKAEEIKEKQRENESKSAQTHKYRPVTIPPYMITPAPLLPTEDCYDSDDEETRTKKYKMPSWGSDSKLAKTQLAMIAVGEKIMNTFFSRQIHTPNLQDIFETIDPKKLKRTSSAVWKKPPRYTLFSETSYINFSEDEDEDIY